MSKAKTDKLGLRLPKELIWGCVCCSLRTNPGKESRAETGASEAAREISSLKVGKMLLQQVDTRIFTNKKKEESGIGRKSLLVNFSFFLFSCHSNLWIEMSFFLLESKKNLNN